MSYIGLDIFLAIFLYAMAAAGVFIAMASKRSVRGGLIALGAVLPIIAIVGIANLLDAATGGKAALSETMPWIGLVAPLVPLAWLHWRSRINAPKPPGAARATRKPPPKKARQPTNSAKPATAAPTVFISYRRADSADVTGRLYDRLATEFGRERVHKDVDSIPLGFDFVEQINKFIGECDVVLAVIGRDWLTMTDDNNRRRLDDETDPVRLEIVAALKRRIPVVPILVGGSTIPPPESLPDDIRKLAFRNGTNVRPDPDFHKDVDRLIAGLRSH
ncbi:MAG: toll/interleukin-1 receptor domain-containing protein [Pseudomonadota bacterium]